MYSPDAFRIDDPATLQAFIECHPLGTLVAMSGGEFIVNHIPMIWRPGVLQGHVARANAVWELPPHTPVVVIFHGAEHYISPSMYPEGSRNLPTWNYSVVHVHGEICFRDSASEALSNVNALAQQYEKARTSPWTVADAPADYVSQLSGRIVPFEISISRMIGKFKANQQRPDRERAFVAQSLAREGASPSDIAELIRDKK